MSITVVRPVHFRSRAHGRRIASTSPSPQLRRISNLGRLMSNRRWQRLDFGAGHRPALEKSDKCYFALDYVPEGRFQDCPGTDLVNNFERDPKIRATDSRLGVRASADDAGP